MPNAINPDDYNIDKLRTGILGPILTTDFRDYVLNFNLDNINPEVVSGGYNLGGLNQYYGDFIDGNPKVKDLPNVLGVVDTPMTFLNGNTPYESNTLMNLWSTLSPYSYRSGNDNLLSSPPVSRSSYTVTTRALTDPGNISDDSNELAENNLRQNTYGPNNFEQYTSDGYNYANFDNTGLIQYKTTPGGDFRSTIIGRQLGFSATNGINYDSELNDVAKEQRKFNVKERIKLNFISDTIGKVNADPLGLLVGQDLISRDYTITQAPGFGGKALEFTKNLVGFNIPTSILPSWKSQPGPGGKDINLDLMRFTSSGTKSLLFSSIELNKWGPDFTGNNKPSSEKTEVKKLGKLVDGINSILGDSKPPGTIKYTDEVEENTNALDFRSEATDPLVDKLNQGVKNLVNGLISQQEEPTIPKPNENVAENPIDGKESYGFDKGYNEIEKNIETEYSELNPKRFVTKRSPDGWVDNQAVDNPMDADLFYWNKDKPYLKTTRGLLNFTQNLIRKDVDGGGNTGAKFIGITNSESNMAPNGKHKIFSQGNRVTVGEGDEKVYCRSWSVRNPYSTYGDTVRHEALRREEVFKSLSILEDNGMPKIVPYPEEYNEWKKSLSDTDGNGSTEPAKYMFSIENLAWRGTKEFNALHNVEKGPNKGRIMWFPPYDINFTDNSSVNWETTQFIGRGEPIYTYNNTERTGSLSFTIITDHPSSLNQIRDDAKSNLERYFAGCEDLSNTAFGDMTEPVLDPEPDTPPPTELPPPGGEPGPVSFYFQNAPNSAEGSPGRDVNTDLKASYQTNPPIAGVPGVVPDIPEGKNFNFESDIDFMIDFLLSEQGKRFRIVVEGYTSSLSTNSYNDKLGEDRAKSLKSYLYNRLIVRESEVDKPINWPDGIEGKDKTFPTEVEWENDSIRWANPISRGEDTSKGGGGGSDEPLTGKESPQEIQNIINDPLAINGRRATIRLEYDGQIDGFMLDKLTNETERLNKEKKAEYNRQKELNSKNFRDNINKLSRDLVNEATYFNKLEVDNSFIYDSLKEKVKYFHPAFHSMTPEGLNSRLNFLKQCTRQGPNINRENEPDNMVFGAPPICVLRIGDFYHTKIVIDSVNISYDPLIWDLNPEGIGVQPMLAKVDLNFKFIGGSSLGGPITELQNAVAFNFFANTSVYNRLKNVTVKTRQDGNVEKETFKYGSYIIPNQVLGEDDNLTIVNNLDEEIELVTRDVDTLGTEVTNVVPDNLSKETNKQIEQSNDEFSDISDVSIISFQDSIKFTKTFPEPSKPEPFKGTKMIYNLRELNGEYDKFIIESKNGGLDEDIKISVRAEEESATTGNRRNFDLNCSKGEPGQYICLPNIVNTDNPIYLYWEIKKGSEVREIEYKSALSERANLKGWIGRTK